MRNELTVINNERNLLEVSFFISSVVFLTILSFPHFFFFIPNFSTGNVFLASIQSFSQIGWIIFLILPPLLLVSNKNSKRYSSKIFLFSVLLWPTSTLLIKLVLLIQTKNLYLEYMVSFPIFLFLELIAPAIYIYLHLRILKLKK